MRASGAPAPPPAGADDRLPEESHGAADRTPLAGPFGRGPAARRLPSRLRRRRKRPHRNRPAMAALAPRRGLRGPHAPEPCPGAPMGRQWFPLTFRDPHERWRGVGQARPGLEPSSMPNCSGSACRRAKLALVGFSQGTMMALHVGLRRSQPPAAVVGFSGLLVLEEGKGPESLKRRGARQAADPPGPRRPRRRHPGRRACSCRATPSGAAEVPCQWHLSAGVGHGIDGEALRQGGLFLVQSLRPALPEVSRPQRPRPP